MEISGFAYSSTLATMLPLKYLLSCPFNFPYFLVFVVVFALRNVTNFFSFLFSFSSFPSISPLCLHDLFYVHIFSLFPIVCSSSPCITKGTTQAPVLLAFLMFPHHQISTCPLHKEPLPCVPSLTLQKESAQKKIVCFP